MDPLTATSLAGSVVQLIDFATKVVSKGQRIYRSADGSLAENNDLELVASDLLILQTKLEKKLPVHATRNDSDDEDAIKRLAAASNVVAKELLQRLDKVKVQGRYRKWNSLRQAVKSVWTKSEVDEIAARLSTFRDEIQARMVFSVSSQMDDNRKIMTEIGNQVQRMYDNTARSPSQPGFGLASSIQIKRERPASPTDSLLYHGEKFRQPDRVISNTIIKAFSYNGETERHETIPKAHAKTFRWILQDHVHEQVPWDNFVEWLRSEDHLYWIRGKAASGKSTLMKFMIQQDELNAALEEWSFPKRLIRANFFFWALGTPLQQSQQGLLLSIIRQIFERLRSSIRRVVPDLWDQISHLSVEEVSNLGKGWHKWTIDELKLLLDLLLRTISAENKLCIFIDGLDEFSGQYAEIAEYFSNLSRLPDVKCCISSRPLPSIEYEFSGCKGLQLQDLTEGCILEFVRDKLSSHRRFVDYKQEHPNDAKDLVEVVVERSSGVFLWVDLVVRSLLDGFTNHDDPQDLRKRLNDLPPELDDLYSTMLRSITPPFYRTQAAKLLQIFYQTSGLMSSIALSFADEQSLGSMDETDSTPLTMEEARKRSERITERLKSRCRGLLEVKKYGHQHTRPDMVDYPLLPDQVQYLHLTVKEFLEKPAVWSEINNWASIDRFDCNVACAKGLIALVRRTIAFHGWGTHILNLLDSALTFVRQAESSTTQSQDHLVEAIDKVASQIYPHSDKLHWSSDWYCDPCDYQPASLLRLCIVKRLTAYVAKRSSTEILALNDDLNEGLLIWAITVDESLLRVGFRNHKTDLFGTFVSLVRLRSDYEDENDATPVVFKDDDGSVVPLTKLLFEFKLDPNETRSSWEKMTPWYRLLTWLENKQNLADQCAVHLLGIVELFILYGADTSTTIPQNIGTIGGKEVIPLLLSIFHSAPTRAINSLQQLIAERTSTEALQSKKMNNAAVAAAAAAAGSSRSLEERITDPAKSNKRSAPAQSNDKKKRRRKRP